MLTSDLGPCEWFVWDLRRSNLIDRGQLDQVIGEFLGRNPGAEPPLLAEYLVKHSYLTEFQAERLLQGKTQGFVLGPFTLMDALGAGSMGTVYKAQSKTDNKWYAVKVLPRRSMWNVRIARRKVRLFEQCNHPSVVPFIDVGTAGGMHYLAWPLVEGSSLETIVQEKGHLSTEESAKYALQIAEGLESAHQANLFHGMLKPSNLMVGKDGVVRILDFGIGCLMAETEGESLVDTMSTANSVNSGLDCASPESIMDPTHLSSVGDQYSLGCVIYFCLTGQYPFPDGTAVEKMMCHQHKQPKPIKDLNIDVPNEMVAIVERLMQKNPKHRFVNCSEVIEQLRPLAFPSAKPAPSSAEPGVLRRPTMRMPRVNLNPVPQDIRGATNGNGPERGPGSMPTMFPRPSSAIPGKPPHQQRPVAPPPLARLSEQGLRNRPEEPGAPVKPPSQAVVHHPMPAKIAAAMAESPSPAPKEEGKFGMVTVVLLSILTGVAAFFLSRLIPF